MFLSKRLRWTIYTAVIIAVVAGGFYLTATQTPDQYTPRDAADESPHAVQQAAEAEHEGPGQSDQQDDTEGSQRDETDEQSEADPPDEPEDPEDSEAGDQANDTADEESRNEDDAGAENQPEVN